MNEIVLEHYPVSKLPDGMRQGFDAAAAVKGVIEQEGHLSEDERWPGFAHLSKRQSKPVTIDELLKISGRIGRSLLRP